jgi:hypothetical protein
MFVAWPLRGSVCNEMGMTIDRRQQTGAFTARRNPRRLLLWICVGALLGLCAAAILVTQDSIPHDFFVRRRLIAYSYVILPAVIVQVSLHIHWLRCPKVILDISTDGLLYTPHSLDRVDWNDIVSVSTASAYGHRYVRVRLSDSVPLKRYRAASLLARINRGVKRRTIEIHVSLLDRSQAEIVRAISNRERRA